MSDDGDRQPIPPPDGSGRKIGPYEQSLREQSQRIARAVARRAARRRRYRILAGVVGVAIVAGIAYGAVKFFGGPDSAPLTSSTSAVPQHCDDPNSVSLAVPPAMVPALRDVAKALASTEDGPCTTFVITSAEAALVARTLDTAARPQGWVTDSSLWVEQATAGGAKLRTTEPFASSAVVVAMDSDRAKTLGSAPTWADIIGVEGGVRFPDPNTSTVGAFSLAALSASLPADAFAATVTASAKAPLAAIDPASLIRAEPPIAAPVAEAALVDFNAANPASALAAVGPAEGVAPLQYSLVTATDDGESSESLQALHTYLGSDKARDILAKHGFRVSGAQPTAPEPQVGAVKLAEPPSAEAVAKVREAWTSTTPQRQVLVALDVSGSMLSRSGQGTRLALAQNAVRAGLASLPESSRTALWVYSNHIGTQGDDFKSLADFGPMSDPKHRAGLERGLAGLDKVVGGGSGLYDSISAAYIAATKSYQAGRTNAIVVIVDGPNEDDFGLSLEQLRSKLARAKNASRPVELIIVGLGEAPDAGALGDLATLVGGRYIAAPQADDLEQAIVGAITGR